MMSEQNTQQHDDQDEDARADQDPAVDLASSGEDVGREVRARHEFGYWLTATGRLALARVAAADPSDAGSGDTDGFRLSAGCGLCDSPSLPADADGAGLLPGGHADGSEFDGLPESHLCHAAHLGLHLWVTRLRPGHWYYDITDARGLLEAGGAATHADALSQGLERLHLRALLRRTLWDVR